MHFGTIKGVSSFPGGSVGKACACNARDLIRSLGREDPVEEEMATHSGILTRKIPWIEKPGAGYSPWVAKSWTRLSDFTFTFYYKISVYVRVCSAMSDFE